MNVLSLFDGCSCGQVALERAGFKIKRHKYFASEIDKYAIKVAMKNYPYTVQLGDIKNWRQWKLPKIDLILAGSPCQDFSIAGKMKGFDGDRSSLIYYYHEILAFYRPEYFLLENVKMKKENRDAISFINGVYPIEINSALVSAQNRKRLYWTNIKRIAQPDDKGIFLKDILENGQAVNKKSYPVSANYIGTSQSDNGIREFKRSRNQIVFKKCEKSNVLDANYFKGLDNYQQRTGVIQRVDDESFCVAERGCVKDITQKTNSLTTVQKDNLIIQKAHGFNKGGLKAKDGKTPSLISSSFEENNHLIQRVGHFGDGSQGQRVYSIKGKSVSLSSEGGGIGATTGLYKMDLPDGEYIIRKLTPVECERLQTLPDNYTSGVSNSQRYKMIGNGWTIDVISHILSFINSS